MWLFIILLGLLLLFFGRALYWAFVGIAGFLMGWELAADLLADHSALVRVLAAVVAGLIGAAIAAFAQRIAFAAGGFFAGGYLALTLVDRVPGITPSNFWFIVGGVIGAIIAALLLDWAIIVLSSFAGAMAIVSPSTFQPEVNGIAFLVLAAVGIYAQSRQLSPTRMAAPPPPAA